jgi:hypothetical protein
VDVGVGVAVDVGVDVDVAVDVGFAVAVAVGVTVHMDVAVAVEKEITPPFVALSLPRSTFRLRWLTALPYQKNILRPSPPPLNLLPPNRHSVSISRRSQALEVTRRHR